MSLKKQTVEGVKWSAFSQGSVQVITFLGSVILARMLSPSVYGLVGMARLFSGFVDNFNQLGLGAALTQRKEVTAEHLSSVFWGNMALSALFYLMTLLCAPAVAHFFREPLVQEILSFSAINFIISSVGTVPKALLMRNMLFKQYAIVELGTVIVNYIVAIALAWQGEGVWSLVWGGIISNLASVFLLLVMSKWHPAFIFNIKRFNELMKFGGFYSLATVLNYFRGNIDNFLIGKMLGSHALGIYSIAYMLFSIPQTRILPAITRVLFPAFSKLQDDDEALIRNILKVLGYTTLFLFPISCGLMMTAPEFIILVYGSKWIEVVRPLQFLCLASICYIVSAILGHLFLAKGRTDLGMVANLASFVMAGSFVYFGIVLNGLVGVGIALAAYSIAIFPLYYYILSKVIKIPFFKTFTVLWPAIFAVAGMCGAIFLIDKFMLSILDFALWSKFTIKVLTGGITYVCLLSLFRFQVWRDAIGFVATSLSGNRR